jgi:hypothetical protein
MAKAGKVNNVQTIVVKTWDDVRDLRTTVGVLKSEIAYYSATTCQSCRTRGAQILPGMQQDLAEAERIVKVYWDRSYQQWDTDFLEREIEWGHKSLAGRQADLLSTYEELRTDAQERIPQLQAQIEAMTQVLNERRQIVA